MWTDLETRKIFSKISKSNKIEVHSAALSSESSSADGVAQFTASCLGLNSNAESFKALSECQQVVFTIQLLNGRTDRLNFGT